MNKVLCSIYDCKGNMWTAPQMFMTNADAIRAFSSAVNSDTPYNKYAEDFTLFLLGTFDESTGFIEIEPAPVNLALGITLLKTENVHKFEYSPEMPNEDA